MAQTHTLGKTATRVEREPDGTIKIRYHWTDVVTIHPNGLITLKDGGYRTATTKLRMNQASNQFALGFSVRQKNHHWYVDINGKTLDYTDWITFNPLGEVYSA